MTPPARGAVKVTCSAGTEYGLGWDERQHQNTNNGCRGMLCKTSETCGQSVVDYDLYRDQAGTQPWKKDWNTPNVPDAVSEGSAKTYDVWGRVYPDQPSVPPGTYHDAVVATTMIVMHP